MVKVWRSLKNIAKIILIKKVSTEDTGNEADFVLKNSSFKFNSKFYKQISGTAIGKKFASPYARIFID